MSRASVFGSAAKVTASDLAVRNAELALEVMGDEGLRVDSGVEKVLRDAKLLQIYEGTNQLNRREILAGTAGEAFAWGQS